MEIREKKELVSAWRRQQWSVMCRCADSMVDAAYCIILREVARLKDVRHKESKKLMATVEAWTGLHLDFNNKYDPPLLQKEDGSMQVCSEI